MLCTKSKNKTGLWNTKAAQVNLEPGSMLKTWYESVRTVRQEERLGNKIHG
ncbi:hypothetical protein DPMN_035221 [Dreissena polymorpha]|uniref:Uncharacterized protein n=1 Tax=Dreissena polymorpha TaxID=45954 RepID=A0A9D4RLP6_DREPO|nr:hypothetical protein DPMN_035221 [Dreissena polymorpha]